MPNDFALPRVSRAPLDAPPHEPTGAPPARAALRRVTVRDRALYGAQAELIVAARDGWHMEEPEPADPPAGWLIGGFFWGCVLLLTALWGWVLVFRVLPKAAGLAVEAGHMAARFTGAW